MAGAATATRFTYTGPLTGKFTRETTLTDPPGVTTTTVADDVYQTITTFTTSGLAVRIVGSANKAGWPVT
ncbi:MAG TPA: hypothetical protein VM784_10845 [Actinomycetota bacterium]|nr:hypothetical protein [Actinomycetota bacterium]